MSFRKHGTLVGWLIYLIWRSTKAYIKIVSKILGGAIAWFAHSWLRPWQDQHSIRKTSKILHTLLSKIKQQVVSTLLKTETNELRCANAGNDWLQLHSCAWIYRSGRFAILKQKQNIGTFCSIVYLREQFHNTENKYGVQMQPKTQPGGGLKGLKPPLAIRKLMFIS